MDDPLSKGKHIDKINRDGYLEAYHDHSNQIIDIEKSAIKEMLETLYPSIIEMPSTKRD